MTSSSYQAANHPQKAARSSPKPPPPSDKHTAVLSTGAGSYFTAALWVQGAAWLFERLTGQSLHTEQDLLHAVLLWVPQGCCTQRQTLQHLQRVPMSAANMFSGDYDTFVQQ